MPSGGLPGKGKTRVGGQASLFQASLGQGCYGAQKLQVEAQASVQGGRPHAWFALERVGLSTMRALSQLSLLLPHLPPLALPLLSSLARGAGKGTAFVPGWTQWSPGSPEPAIPLGQRRKWHFPCWDGTL